MEDAQQQSQEDGVSTSPPGVGGHSEGKEVPASPPEASKTAGSPDSSQESETEGTEMSVEHQGEKEAPTSSEKDATSTATKASRKKKKKKKKKKRKKSKGMSNHKGVWLCET